MDKVKDEELEELAEEIEVCKAITFAEQRKILRSLKDEKYRRFFYFCCCTGVRVCEALSIKHKDIDMARNVIKIKLPDTKTKKHKREIPFIPELFEGMTIYKTSNKLLFPDITDEGSKQYFYKFYKKLGLDLSRHSARHTFVSVCGYVGIDAGVVQQWAGHVNLKMTTDTYTHALEKGTSPVLKYLRNLKRELKQLEKTKRDNAKTSKSKSSAAKTSSAKKSSSTTCETSNKKSADKKEK